MMNPQRGEVSLRIGGATRRLCLTLGALAELEAAFGAEDFRALGVRLGRMSGEDLRVVLGALLRGGGETCAPDGAEWSEAARAAAACFRRALA